MESVLDRLRTSIPLMSTDRDRIRIALLSALRESEFLLEATFNRRIARACAVPIAPSELTLLYPMTAAAGDSQQGAAGAGPQVNWDETLRDFFADASNRKWKSPQGVRLMNYMIHTVNSEEFFVTAMGTLQRSDLRRLGALVSEFEEPDAIYLNALTQEIADGLTTTNTFVMNL